MSSSTSTGHIEDSKFSRSFLTSKNRIRIQDLQESKKRNEKWAMLTSYDFVSARVFDQAKIPCLLVGDSAAQTVYGYRSTLPVTMDELIPLARAVSSACSRALVIADLPFGSYQESPQQSLRSAVRFMKESGVHGVKLEGGQEYYEHVKLLTQSGIPVMAHIGFTPQSEHSLSGFKIQGKDESAISKICQDALALEQAGAFSCVLELVPADVGRLVTDKLKIPTVGIGAGPGCDAQILVWHDMAGFSPPETRGGYLTEGGEPTETNTACQQEVQQLKLARVPKFVQRYTNLSSYLYQAAIAYANDVAEGRFPSEKHSY